MAEGNTRYHYDPSMVAAVIFIVVFSLSGIYHTYQVIRLRSWYFIPFIVGSIGINESDTLRRLSNKLICSIRSRDHWLRR